MHFNHSNSVFPKYILLIFVLCGMTNQLFAQNNSYYEDIDLKVKTSGKMLTANKLIFIVEIEVPEGWKLKVEEGFESMWQSDIDTVDMALKFRESREYRLLQRLKADRKPSPKGYYYKDITFAQTIAIDTSKLPIDIDAELKWFAYRLDEKKAAKGLPCSLLQVCAKRDEVKTLRVGWNCQGRRKVYLEDVLK